MYLSLTLLSNSNRSSYAELHTTLAIGETDY